MEHKPDSREQLHLAEKTKEQGTELFFISETATTKNVPFPADKVIEFSSKLTLGQALHQLADNGIVSAPVWDDDTSKYLGFVDLFDLMTLAVGVDVLTHLLPPEIANKRPKTMKEVEFQKELTLKDMLEDNLNRADGSYQAWRPVEEGTPLRFVIKLLATQARRIPVLSAQNGRVVQIISQSQIAHLLNDYVIKAKIVDDGQTLEKTGFGLRPVFTVKDTAQAREAFQIMTENKVSSVCVVDSETGAVVTAISTKDIRLLPRLESVTVTEEKSPFDWSCAQFAQRVRRDEYKTKASCVVVELTDTLFTVLGKLAATKMHRVYVINSQRQPVGVISVSDVVVALQQIQPST